MKTLMQTEARKRKRVRSQYLQDPKLQAIVIQHGSSPLARALVARLRRKYAAALRPPRRPTDHASTFSRFGTSRSRLQKETKQVKQILSTIVEESEVSRWLAAPNMMLRGARPIDKIRQGRSRQVIEILTAVQESIHV